MIIRAHSVPLLPSGMSPMQERLLRSDRYVRLVSAPTGAGKSYAFMRAVLDEGAHVLFIVPTKRLLQNLMEDAREQARQRLRQRGLDDPRIGAWLDERIIEWSGNQDASGRESLSATRVRQFLDGAADIAGRVIFAVPEVVVTMISGIAVAGASALNPFLYLRRFDHVVFDEFHTIDDRSFGLACLLSLLAVEERKGRVSLLSATPVDVTKVLTRAGIGRDDIETISEEIADGHPPRHRPIHGNVAVTLRDCALPESFAKSIDRVREAIARGGGPVVVVYDSLQRLVCDEPAIRRALVDGGIPDARVLQINSIDDSERRPGEPRRGGRYEDPRGYNVLLCTSSVEIGVTFRSTLMFTDPGHGLASFVQRVGRVSRGPDDGQVFVSLTRERRRRHAWTRRVAAVVERSDELAVHAFVDEILRDVRRHLEPGSAEMETDPAADGAVVPFYRRTSWRGVYWAALFIVAVECTKMKVQREARARLARIAPRVVKWVRSKIREIRSVGVVNGNERPRSQPHQRWVNALLTSALTYRDIGAVVDVVDPDGSRHRATESFLRRANVPLIFDEEDGARVVRLSSRTLKEEIRMRSDAQDAERLVREAQRLTLHVRSPIGVGDFSLSIPERDKATEGLHRRLVDEWRRRFADFIPAPGEHVSDPRKKVMAAATALVDRLGRPPLDEDYEDSEEIVPFA